MSSIKKDQIIRDSAALTTYMGEVKKTGKALDLSIQIMLASACAHLHQHGTIDVVNTALDSVNKGARLNAAKEFIDRFAPVNWNEKAKKFIYAKGKKVEDFEASPKFQTMLDTFWADLKPEAPFRGFDFATQLAALLKKAKDANESVGALTDEEKAKVKVSAAEIAALEALAKTIDTDRKAQEAAAALVVDAEQAEDAAAQAAE